MKKQLYFLLIAVCSSTIILSSCGKDDDDNTTPAKTKTQLIMQGSWSFDKVFQGAIDVSGVTNACYKDNIVTFTSSTNGTVNEGAIVCASPAPATFTWSWQNSETILALNTPFFPGGSTNFTLVSLTETALVVSQVANFGAPGDPQAYTFHYKH
ncbi:MAG: hypothetical protein HOP10_08780 [Chitinophagaceae bacterium]|nr:hypothetical protein [Chitinophagaceae bacterium]